MEPLVIEYGPLRFPESGLLPAVAQDALSGEVLMVAWVNAEAVAAAQRERKAWFYSRSRNRLWCKGETSGHTLVLERMVADCDQDTLLYLVQAHGPACHRETRSCFAARGEGRAHLLGQLAELTDTIAERASLQGEAARKSYVSRLLAKGPDGPGAKVIEEAAEVVAAARGESHERVISEAADVLFHLLVLLQSRGGTIYEVLRELRRREGVGGLVEKASRSPVDGTR